MRAPKAAPVFEESEDEAIPAEDMETLLLDYLVTRKRSQQDKRIALWSQLAGLA